MQRFQVFEEVITTKDSCSFRVYGLSLESHSTDPGPSGPQWALHATQMFLSHLRSILFPFVSGACESLLLQASVSVMNDFPNISITPPLHQFSDQQTLQMVYFDQIYQCKRVHLIEESMNFKSLNIVMLFIGGIHWQNAIVKELILWAVFTRSIYLSIHLSNFLQGNISAQSLHKNNIDWTVLALCLVALSLMCWQANQSKTKDIKHIYTSKNFNLTKEITANKNIFIKHDTDSTCMYWGIQQSEKAYEGGSILTDEMTNQNGQKDWRRVLQIRVGKWEPGQRHESRHIIATQ